VLYLCHCLLLGTWWVGRSVVVKCVIFVSLFASWYMVSWEECCCQVCYICVTVCFLVHGELGGVLLSSVLYLCHCLLLGTWWVGRSVVVKCVIFANAWLRGFICCITSHALLSVSVLSHVVFLWLKIYVRIVVPWLSLVEYKSETSNCPVIFRSI